MRCSLCDRELPVDSDPRRIYCSNACRQRAYTRRLHDASRERYDLADKLADAELRREQLVGLLLSQSRAIREDDVDELDRIERVVSSYGRPGDEAVTH